MSIELISAAQVAALPDGPEGFLQFEKICREELAEQLSHVFSDNADRPYRAAYLSSISAAASEYGVDPTDQLAPHRFAREFNGDEYSDFTAFDVAVRGLVTKVQIQTARTIRAGELTLSQTDQTKIEHHISVLRERIAKEPTFDDAKRKVLYKKLDELSANLKAKKIDLARTMVIVGAFFTALNQAEAALIKLPESIGSIAKLVTLAKEYQESLLPPPPKQITGPKENFDLGDEIPF